MAPILGFGISYQPESSRSCSVVGTVRCTDFVRLNIVVMLDAK